MLLSCLHFKLPIKAFLISGNLPGNTVFSERSTEKYSNKSVLYKIYLLSSANTLISFSEIDFTNISEYKKSSSLSNVICIFSSSLSYMSFVKRPEANNSSRSDNLILYLFCISNTILIILLIDITLLELFLECLSFAIDIRVSSTTFRNSSYIHFSAIRLLISFK